MEPDHRYEGEIREGQGDEPVPGDDVPVTGDPVVDAATAQLAAADPADLDAQIEAGERVHQALRSRLSDLGG
jgi:hypothetical protein